MISWGYKAGKSALLATSRPILPIPHWWQLPFAMALLKNTLLPARCYLCGIYGCQKANAINPAQGNAHWFNQLAFLCDGCHQSIAWQNSQFALELLANNQLISVKGIASSYYDFPYQQVIRDFKNSHQLDKLPLLIHAVRQLAIPPSCHASNSVIVPVPTTTARLTQRGFDPVTILVQYLSFHWQIPVFGGVVREERQKQQGLTREQRLTNTQNAFGFTELPSVPNVIFFDDVATTGATLQSLAQSLVASVDGVATYTIHARALLHGNWID